LNPDIAGKEQVIAVNGLSQKTEYNYYNLSNIYFKIYLNYGKNFRPIFLYIQAVLAIIIAISGMVRISELGSQQLNSLQKTQNLDIPFPCFNAVCNHFHSHSFTGGKCFQIKTYRSYPNRIKTK
jgi:hypothetical protein